MELLLVLIWFGFLVYIAKTRTGTIQLHLVIVWGLMLLASVWALVKLLFNWLRS